MAIVAVHQSNKLRRFNDGLTVLVISLGLYIIVTPFLPKLQLWWHQRQDTSNGFHYQSNLANQAVNQPERKADLPKPPNRRLVIPAIQVDDEIFDGKSANTLEKGIWRRPKTSTPDKGGNTVLVAHRFVYHGKAAFYNLDKIKKDDVFAAFWDGKEYDYKISEIRVVEPTAIEIENNTTEPIMTLYTCTPMWTAKQRLVIIAKLTSETPTL